MEKNVKITSEENLRIDKFLVQKFSDYSRTYLQTCIERGCVKINEKTIAKVSNIVKNGDIVEILFPKEFQYELKPEKVDFDIIFTHKDFAVINKPAGLLVHYAPNSKNSKTLTSGLIYSFEELKEFQDAERPGIVHRLDKLTSGLMIIARNIKAKMKLSEIFKNRRISKTYLAVVNGHPPIEGSINFPIGRNPVYKHKMSHQGIHSRDALTYYRVLAYYKDMALVEARIITGRTHQIRVHFAAIGHYLIGDVVYGEASKLIDRQALHSWKIVFEYEGEKFKFSHRVPEDFKVLLKGLSKERIPFEAV